MQKLTSKLRKKIKNKQGEGYVSTGVKILIAVVIGAIVFTSLYGVSTLVTNSATDKVSSLFSYTGVAEAGGSGGGAGGGEFDGGVSEKYELEDNTLIGSAFAMNLTYEDYKDYNNVVFELTYPAGYNMQDVIDAENNDSVCFVFSDKTTHEEIETSTTQIIGDHDSDFLIDVNNNTITYQNPDYFGYSIESGEVNCIYFAYNDYPPESVKIYFTK